MGELSGGCWGGDVCPVMARGGGGGRKIWCNEYGALLYCMDKWYRENMNKRIKKIPQKILLMRKELFYILYSVQLII